MKYKDKQNQDLFNHIKMAGLNYYVFDSKEFQNLLENIYGHGVVSADRLCILYQIAKCYKDYPMAELGVYKGGTAFVLASQCNKTVYLYDTFEGMPEPSHYDNRKKGDFCCSIEEVQDYLKDFKHIKYFKGIFPETASDLEQGLGFVHLDGDLYKTTMDGLNYFYPRLINSGVIVLDDYGFISEPGCAMAVNDWMFERKDLLLTLETGQALIFKREL